MMKDSSRTLASYKIVNNSKIMMIGEKKVNPLLNELSQLLSLAKTLDEKLNGLELGIYSC
jgi:hypothetical protein